jgi:hypothetical protein
MPEIRVVDLERGLPTVDEARRRLANAIELARRDHVRVLKVIHGYGSTGSGGRLRTHLRASLRIARKNSEIRLFVTGEEFRISDERAWELLRKCPELKQDSDLGRGNPGITLVLI